MSITSPVAPPPRPEFVTDEHLEYLDKLRESGDTNMFGACPYLMGAFPALGRQKATTTLIYWMQTFESRHKKVKS